MLMTRNSIGEEMANQTERQPTPDPDNPFERVSLEADEEQVDWSKALQELEQAEPPAAPPPQPREEPVEQAAQQEDEAPAKPAYIPKPPRKAPVIPDNMPPADELSEVLTSVNSALNQLKRFESAHKNMIAPNIYRVWEDSLREAATVMTREYRRLRETATEQTPPENAEDRAAGDEK